MKVLGLSKREKFNQKPKSGLRAAYVNEFLHADTTFWDLPNGQKVATVFVSDNFSRHVLGHHASLSHGFQNVKTALEGAVRTIRSYHPKETKTSLIVDGGGENNAKRIEDFVATAESPELVKWIAQKDIAFSNSPVEAINKIFKRYLRHFQPQNFAAFQNMVSFFVEDYTQKRPHGSLDGLTPFEVYTGQNLVPDNLRTAFQQAKAARIEANQKLICSNCQ
jgi:putative transposase